MAAYGHGGEEREGKEGKCQETGRIPRQGRGGKGRVVKAGGSEGWERVSRSGQMEGRGAQKLERSGFHTGAKMHASSGMRRLIGGRVIPWTGLAQAEFREMDKEGIVERHTGQRGRWAAG